MTHETIEATAVTIAVAAALGPAFYWFASLIIARARQGTVADQIREDARRALNDPRRLTR